MIVKHSYTRSHGTARAAAKYYEFRPRGPGEPRRQFWTRDAPISRRAGLRMLGQHQQARYVAHRLMLSPSGRERPQDMQRMTRYMMGELEKRMGMELHWFAVQHSNTEHDHVHVIIAGAGERLSDGATRGVRLGKGDYAHLREVGREYCLALGEMAERSERALPVLPDDPEDPWMGRQRRGLHRARGLARG
jgi:hypothetical protein